MRSFVESYAFLAIPVAGFIAWAGEKRKSTRISLYIIVLLLSLHSVFHTIQYYTGVIHYEGMTKKAYFHNFWRVKMPEDYWDDIDFPDYEKAMKGER